MNRAASRYYRRPRPRYGLACAGCWRPASDWEVVNGRFQRVWSGPRRARRRAIISRGGGVWSWTVQEWRGGAWHEIARALPSSQRPPYFAAQQAMPFADLAASTR